jgi:hypothetical protein
MGVGKIFQNGLRKTKRNNMESKKQTTVEWLIQELINNGQIEFTDDNFKLLRLAKEMEKEQMKEVAWHFKEVDMKKSNKGNIIDLEFNQYYDETYGKQ